ncbi:MAG: radical SAM protein [Kiritimatiellae bacterium]|nr:radical SAM protein [Kiritimatiellia bacterium]
MNIKRLGLYIMSRLRLSQVAMTVLFSLYSKCKGLLEHGDWTYIHGLAIETMEACNRKCPYCPVSKMPPRHGKMSEALFDKIINDLSAIRFDGVIDYAFYGEPLLDKRLVGFVQKSKAKLPKCLHRIYTNGDFLTESLYNDFVEAGLDYFVVTDHDNNPKSLEFFARLPKVRFQQAKDLFLTDRAGAVDVKQHVWNKYLQILFKFTQRNCFANSKPMIGYDGRVHLCCQDAFKETHLGDLNTESMKDIIARYKPMRVNISTGKKLPEICRRCAGHKDN